jgi:hypothetical protein
MIKETDLNRGRGRAAESGDSVCFFWFFALLGCLLLSHQSLLSQPSDSLRADTSLLTAAQKKNHAAVISLKWRYKGRNVNGIALHGFSDDYGPNTTGYRINGIELSLFGGAKTLNGIALGFGTLSTYGAVNGIIVHSLFTSVGHLRGASGPTIFAEYDTLDGIGLFSFFTLHYQFQGVSVAGFWQTGGIGNGISVSGIGHQYDDAFRGAAACGVVGIYDGLFRGITVSGIGNKFSGNASGLAFSGIYNYASQGFSGVSISLLRNKSGGQFNGLQTGMFCRAEELAGVQAGLINRSNRVSGVQFGLVNIIHSNPKGRRVLPFVNWCFSSLNDTLVSSEGNRLFLYKIYSPEGVLKHEYNLKNGLLHGRERYFLDNRSVEKEINWYNGKKYGWEYDNLDPDKTAMFWKDDSLLIYRHKIVVPLTENCLSGEWFLEEHTTGKRVTYLVRDIERDTINFFINGIRNNVHHLGRVGNAMMYGHFNNGRITGIYVESASHKKYYGTVEETTPSHYSVNIIIREKDLFAYDEYSSSAASYIYRYFPPNSRITLSLKNTSGTLLYSNCLIYDQKLNIRSDTNCLYFRIEEWTQGEKILYWNNDSVKGYYKNSRLAYKQLLTSEITRDSVSPVPSVATLSLAVFYKNKQCAIYQTKDTLLIYNKHGKPIQRQYKDSLTLFRKDGSAFLFYRPGYRKYTDKKGRIIADRSGDSLFKYDSAGKLNYFACVENDSMQLFSARDSSLLFSGKIFSCPYGFFSVVESGEVESEIDVVFLLIDENGLLNYYGGKSIRLYKVKEYIDPLFPFPIFSD